MGGLSGGFGGYQPQGGGYQPQGGGSSQNNQMFTNFLQQLQGGQGGGTQPGGGYTGGGYNPQPMGGSTYSPGPPGWDMRLGKGGVDYMTAGASRSTPGTPDWLKLQLGQNEDQPYAVDPNRYGRFNWGTNLQGQGIPSPFGQYAQQFAQYPQIPFPPPPAGGGPGAPPPGGGPGVPPPPPNPSGMNMGDLVRQYSAMSNADPGRAALEQEIVNRTPQGQAWGTNINAYNAGGSNYDQQASRNASTNAMLTATDPYSVKWRAANPQWVAAATKAVGGK